MALYVHQTFMPVWYVHGPLAVYGSLIDNHV
jgi:hypothetical protein